MLRNISFICLQEKLPGEVCKMTESLQAPPWTRRKEWVGTANTLEAQSLLTESPGESAENQSESSRGGHGERWLCLKDTVELESITFRELLDVENEEEEGIKDDSGFRKDRLDKGQCYLPRSGTQAEEQDWGQNKFYFFM